MIIELDTIRVCLLESEEREKELESELRQLQAVKSKNEKMTVIVS